MGTIINATAVLVAGILGVLLKKGIRPGVHSILMHACGVSTIFVGASGVMSKMLVITDGRIETTGTMLLIFSLVIGGLLGELIDIEARMNSIGERIKALVKKQNDTMFVDGFVNVSLIICVGAMAIVGSMQDGINGDYSMLCAKSVLDFVIVMVFASTHGIGAAFSALPLFVYQGAITVVAMICGSFVSDGVIADLSLVGSALIFAVGVNLVFGKKIKVGNMLPSLVVAGIFNSVIKFLG